LEEELNQLSLNILVVSQYFWPENFRINDLAQELATRGHRVTVLTGEPNYPEGFICKDFLADRDKFSNYRGVEVIRVPLIPRGVGSLNLLVNYLSFFLSACAFGPWKLRNHPIDVVLTCQLSPVTVGLPAALISKIKRVPMAMWVLDIWPDSVRAVGVVKSPRILFCLEKMVSFIYSRCNLILAQSLSFIPKIQKLSGSKIPVEYFPSWAEEVFNNKTALFAPEIIIRDKVFNVMFAGNIGEAQDFGCILLAAELLKEHLNIQWLIVGDGRMMNWVQNQIEFRGLSKNVRLLGRFPVERMPEFFHHADAMLVTLSDQEVFSMTIPGKLQSYLAVGLPILGALNGEGADVVNRANAGFTCPAGDYKELSAIVLKMSRLALSERNEMGRNGLNFSKTEFDRTKLINKLEFLLNNLVCDLVWK